MPTAQTTTPIVQCRGFSPALAGFKQEVNSKHSELPRENPGSKWPKTSFGAVKDNQRLTPENLSALMDLCRQVTSSYVSRTLDRAAVNKRLTSYPVTLFRAFSEAVQDHSNRVLVHHLDVVLYKCRSALL